MALVLALASGICCRWIRVRALSSSSSSFSQRRPSQQPSQVALETLRFDTTTNTLQSSKLDELAVFYKLNRGGRLPRVKPGHAQYTLQWKQQHDENDTTMIATLRICPCYENTKQGRRHGMQVVDTTPDWLFLRALCVAEPHRRQGWALSLIQQALQQEYSTLHHHYNMTPPVFLFAEPSLASLYHKAGFVPVDALSNNHSETVNNNNNHQEANGPFGTSHTPHSLRQRHASINRRLVPKGKQVLCFGRRHSCHYLSPRLNVLLLQHGRELNRPTGTGQLVKPSTTTSSTQPATSSDVNQQQQSAWQVSQCAWSGRADNDRIEQHLRHLRNQGHKVVLLWKGANATSVTSFLGRDTTTTSLPTTIPVTFVVLDGTWQEAASMFRKIPTLPTLSRLSLEARGRPSVYRLRGDFGWKQRFGTDKNDKNSQSSSDDKASSLLCTVEVVAELLEQAGYMDEGGHLRQRLDAFMEAFPGGRPKKDDTK